MLAGFFSTSQTSFGQASFDSANCYAQDQGTAPAVSWHVKGVATIKNIPNGTTTIYVTFKFQKFVNNAWVQIREITQSGGPNNGAATMDTGFLLIQDVSQSGQQFRVLVSGSYVVGGMPPTTTPLTGIGSNAITPVP